MQCENCTDFDIAHSATQKKERQTENTECYFNRIFFFDRTNHTTTTMKFRPDFALRHLRMEQQQSVVDTLRSDGPLLRLRWLRTLFIDCSDVSVDQQDVFVHDTLAVQRRSVLPCAVQRVVVYGMRDSGTLQQYLQSLPLLTALDLRKYYTSLNVGCSDVRDLFLCAVADAHPWLQRMYLPQGSSVPQSTLERFKQLEELDVTICRFLCSHAASTVRGPVSQPDLLWAAACDEPGSAARS